MKTSSMRAAIGLARSEFANTKFGTGRIPRRGLILQSDYYLMSRPVLWMGFVFGRIPYSVRSGWMRYRYKSFHFAYAVLLALTNMLCHAYYHKEITQVFLRTLEDDVSFTNVLLSFFIITQPFSTIVQVYSWVFELPAIVKCYNRTAILEKKIFNVLPTCSHGRFIRRLATFLFALFFVSLLTVAYFLTYNTGRFAELPKIMILLMIVNIAVTFSYSALWCFNFYFIKNLAVKLNEQMLLCLQVRNNCLFQLKTVRKIWICIWKQSRSYSRSIAVSISFILVTNAIIFVIGCYGLSVSLRKDKLLEIVEMLPYVGFTFANIAFVFEMSYQATNKLGRTFLHNLIIHDRDSLGQECIVETEKFITTISLARNATITLKDYMTMDRTLLISFLSYSVTYLIVLLQLQDKNNNLDCTPIALRHKTNQTQ